MKRGEIAHTVTRGVFYLSMEKGFALFSGLAYFAQRGLNIPGGMFRLPIVILGGLFSYFNLDVFHEQLFFEDGRPPSNLGSFNDGIRPDPFPIGYTPIDSGYDDCVMRKAVATVSSGPYRPICNNCQDWADAARKRYQELIGDPQTQFQCGCRLR